MKDKQTSAEKLALFCKKLRADHYANPAGARSALGGLKLDETDKQPALEAIMAHYAPKKRAPKEKVPLNATDVQHLFGTARSAHDVANEALYFMMRGEETKPYEDSELQILFDLIMKHDALAAFSRLFPRYSDRVAPPMLRLELLAKTPRFFDYVRIILEAPAMTQGTSAGILGLLGEQLEYRRSDPAQIKSFEKLASTRSTWLRHDFIGPYIMEYASIDFANKWLVEHSMPTLGVEMLGTRLLSMYIDQNADAGVLVDFVELFEPQLSMVEQVIRTLLSKRKLGDALRVAQVAPAKYTAQLHRLLHPVVRQYGDTAGLLLFGAVFGHLIDKCEIKHLVKERLEGTPDKAIDDLIDGVSPYDYFDSVSTDMPSELADNITRLRNKRTKNA